MSAAVRIRSSPVQGAFVRATWDLEPEAEGDFDDQPCQQIPANAVTMWQRLQNVIKRGAMHQWPYWSLFYHVVWATKHRQPVIADALIEPIVNAITQTARDSGVVVHAVGVMPDHIHVLGEIPPSIALATIIGQWKGASSHAANTNGPAATAKIAWQSGYGVHSVSARNLERVREYVLNQRQRHAAKEVYGAYERTGEER